MINVSDRPIYNWMEINSPPGNDVSHWLSIQSSGLPHNPPNSLMVIVHHIPRVQTQPTGIEQLESLREIGRYQIK
jgi:hypothetical protein